jgi:hypothetical protein
MLVVWATQDVVRMVFSDVPTRIWRVRGPGFGTGLRKMVQNANGQKRWENFEERENGGAAAD